jgi:hypothetical protein
MTTDVFRAIADPTRRAILDLLADGELAVKDIQPAFPAAADLPARAEPFAGLRGRLERYERFWASKSGQAPLPADELRGPSGELVRLILGAGFRTRYRKKLPAYLDGHEVRPEAEDRGSPRHAPRAHLRSVVRR